MHRTAAYSPLCCHSNSALGLAAAVLIGQTDVLCLHIGQRPFEESCWIQVKRQCCRLSAVCRFKAARKALPYGRNARICHPLSVRSVNAPSLQGSWGQSSHSAQSSPGYLHVGHVPSNCTRQIPQTSSSGLSHLHDATAFHSLMVTFILAQYCQY